MTILIVDDNAKMRGLIRSLLTGKRFRCHECADGGSALAQSDVLHPDVVLMDVEMEPMDGITATRLIKLRHPEIKVIVLTDDADRRTQEAAHAAGADGFLKKEDLISVENVLERISAGQT